MVLKKLLLPVAKLLLPLVKKNQLLKNLPVKKKLPKKKLQQKKKLLLNQKPSNFGHIASALAVDASQTETPRSIRFGVFFIARSEN
jgi:3-deoxy-D-manno-octulosonic acid (KDO) 8-phosphate synthase